MPLIPLDEPTVTPSKKGRLIPLDYDTVEVPKPKKLDLIDAMAGTSPEQLRAEGSPVRANIMQTGKDVFTIPANFFNQLAFNAPRSILGKSGFKYPSESENLLFQVPNKALGVMGALHSPLNYAIGKNIVRSKLGQAAITGAAQGAMQFPEDPLDMKSRAGQAVIGAIAAPAIGKVGKFLSRRLPSNVVPENYGKDLEKNAGIYRNVLNPGKGIIQDIEVKSGKKVDDYMKLAAEENLIIKSEKDGKIDTSGARLQLQDRKLELEAQLDSALATNPAKQFSLVALGEKAKESAKKAYKDPTEYKSAIKDIDDQVADAVEMYGPTVDGVTANRIKQGKWSVAFNQLKPTNKKTSRMIGWAIKDEIEKQYPDQVIKETNDRLGKYMGLEKILEKTHGNVVQRGKLGGYFAQGIGAMAGSKVPIVGPLAGAFLGSQVSKFMSNPERITKNLKLTPPVETQTSKFLSGVGKGVSNFYDQPTVIDKLMGERPSVYRGGRNPVNAELVVPGRLKYNGGRPVTKALPNQAPEVIIQPGAQEAIQNKQPMLPPPPTKYGAGFSMKEGESMSPKLMGGAEMRPGDVGLPVGSEFKTGNQLKKEAATKKFMEDVKKNILKPGTVAGFGGGALVLSSSQSDAAERGKKAADIDMSKIYAIESSNNPKAFNKFSGARGLGQITPIVLREWNNLHPNDRHNSNDLFDPDVNKKISSWYMNDRLPKIFKSKKIADTTKNRLVGYNFGPGNIGKPLPKETSSYIKKYMGGKS